VSALRKTVEDPACDLGTALAIYLMGAPGFDQRYRTAKEVDGWRRPTFTFLRASRSAYSRRCPEEAAPIPPGRLAITRRSRAPRTG
jgi:hypothetical protein